MPVPLHIGSFGREAETEAFLSYIAHEQPHAVMLASVLSFLHRAAAQTCASEAREGRERDRQRERETERERDREREREKERGSVVWLIGEQKEQVFLVGQLYHFISKSRRDRSGHSCYLPVLA